MATSEEIRAMLDSEEGRSVLSELGFTPKEDVDKQLQGLISKKDELLAKIADPKLKEAKKKAALFDEIMSSAGGEGEPESGAETLIQMLERAKNPGKTPEAIEMERELLRTKNMLEQSKAEIEAREQKIAENENYLKSMMVRNKTIQLLQNEGCTKVQAESVASYILGKTQFDLITDENGSRKAVNINGQSPEDFFNEWVKSDESRELLPATNQNRGAGASGSHSSGQPRNFKTELEAAQRRGDKAAIIRINREFQQAQRDGLR